MLRSFFLGALTVTLVAWMAESVQAAGSCCCSPSAPAVTAQPAAPVAQAQRPQAIAAIRISPRACYGYSGTGNFGFVDSGTRWAPAYRPAAAKARGNY